MGLTRAQRHNRMMDKIFDRAKSEGRGLVGNSHTDGLGVNSPAMKEARAKHNALKTKTSGFNHEQHAKHNRNIEAIDKKFGIGAHDPKRFK